MSLKREIAKANVFFTIGNISSAIIAFFFSIILARLLQPHDFGLYSFCIVVASFFVLFTDFGMKSTLTRFVADYIGKGKYRKVSTLTKLIFKYKIVLTVVIGIFVSIFSDQIATFIFNKPEAGFVVLFSGFVLIADSLFKFFESLLSGLKNFLVVSLAQILHSAFKIVFVIGLVLLGMGITGAVTGLIISYLLVVGIYLAILYKKYNFIISESRVKLNKNVLLTFSGWVFISSIVGSIYGLIDQLMISNMLTIESVGFYKIAVTWMFSIGYLVPIANYVLYPYFSGASSKKQVSLMFFNSLRYSAIFAFPLSFVLSAYSKPFILFLYKESYLPAASALSILALNSVLVTLYGVLMTYFIGIKRPDIATKIVSCTIILNVVLNYFLIQSYGISGAAVATLISTFINSAILFSVAVFVKKMMFKPAIILKPFMASLLMYFVSIFFLPNVVNYFTLALYGLLSLLLYFIVMVMIKGITKRDLGYIKEGILRMR